MSTKESILAAGLAAWPNVTARGVARRLGLTHGAVRYHFPGGIRQAVIERAVADGIAPIVASLIVAGDEAVRHLSPDQRQAYLRSV